LKEAVFIFECRLFVSIFISAPGISSGPNQAESVKSPAAGSPPVGSPPTGSQPTSEASTPSIIQLGSQEKIGSPQLSSTREEAEADWEARGEPFPPEEDVEIPVVELISPHSLFNHGADQVLEALETGNMNLGSNGVALIEASVRKVSFSNFMVHHSAKILVQFCTLCLVPYVTVSYIE
jgi:hypothetical protein